MIYFYLFIFSYYDMKRNIIGEVVVLLVTIFIGTVTTVYWNEMKWLFV